MVVERQGDTYLFDSPFEADADDYSSHYNVYLLPKPIGIDLDDASWQGLTKKSDLVGQVPVTAVKFDFTRRRSISEKVFESL